MSTSLATMRSEVKLAFGNRTDMDTMFNQWLNQSQRKIAQRLRIFEIEAVVPLTLTAGNSTLTRPADLWLPIVLVNVDNANQEVKLKPLVELLTQEATPPGTVDRYTMRTTQFIFRPAALADTDFELTYKKNVPLMTDSVGLTLPDEFSRAVVLDALVHGLHILNEEDRAQVFQQQLIGEISALGDQRAEEVFSREDGTVLRWSGYEGAR